MVNFKKLTDKAKQQVDKRGGTDALKGDLDELKDIAKGKGSIKDKAKAAGQAIKEPGKRGNEPDSHGSGGKDAR
jgi:hypothetical protein